MTIGTPLPRLLVVLDKGTCRDAGRSPVDLARGLIRAGARFLWYRNHVEPPLVYYKEIQTVARITAAAKAELMVGERADIAVIVGATGVHLKSDGLPVRAARELPGILRAGRSCHSLSEARAADLDGASYLTLSPIFETIAPKTSPRTPLGLAALRQVTRDVPVPVFALGGITADRIEACLHAGAYGVAVMGSVLLADDAEAAFAVLRQRLDDLTGGSAAP